MLPLLLKSFGDRRLIFGHRKSWELLRWYAFLRLCRNRAFSKRAYPVRRVQFYSLIQALLQNAGVFA